MKAMLRRSFRSVALIGLAMVTGLAVVALVAGADVTNTLNSLGVSGIGQCPASAAPKSSSSGADCPSLSDVVQDAIARKVAALADAKVIENDPGACGIAAAAEAALNNANALAKISGTGEAEGPKADADASCCMTEKTDVAAKAIDFSAAKVAPVLGTAKASANASESHSKVAKVAPVAGKEDSECCLAEKTPTVAKVADAAATVTPVTTAKASDLECCMDEKTSTVAKVADVTPVAATKAADLECCMDAAPAVAAKAEAPASPAKIADAAALPECCQVKEVVVIDAPAAQSGN